MLVNDFDKYRQKTSNVFLKLLFTFSFMSLHLKSGKFVGI